MPHTISEPIKIPLMKDIQIRSVWWREGIYVSKLRVLFIGLILIRAENLGQVSNPMVSETDATLLRFHGPPVAYMTSAGRFCERVEG
jgi:hypothetical protein